MNTSVVVRGPQVRGLECGSGPTASPAPGMQSRPMAAAPLPRSKAGSARRGHKVALGSDI